VATALFCLLALASSVGAFAQERRLPVVTIGVVIDGPWERNNEISSLFQNEVISLSERDFDIRFPDDKQIVADWTVAGVRAALDRLLSDPDVDIVYAMGLLASNEAVQRRDLRKPLIAPFIDNAYVQGAPAELVATDEIVSGVHNLTYLTSPWAADRDLEFLYQLVPFEKVAVFVDALLIEGSGVILQNIEEIARQYEVEAQIIAVGSNIEPALAELGDDVDAVMVSALLTLPESEFEELIAGLIERKLPSMALFGRRDVERGLMLAIAPDTNFDRIARRVAINTQRILLGEDAASLSVQFDQPEHLVINMATAREVGYSPTWDVLTRAELLDEVDLTRPVLRLEDAVAEAIEANLDFLASARVVAAGEQQVREARSFLLPQANISALGLMIDADRAAASFGQQAERSFSATIGFSQVLYSDPAWANLEIQQRLQDATVLDRQALRLDIIEATAVAYLNVLRAQTAERIQKENVELSQSNLARARARESIGVASRAEVLRWESRIAADRSGVIDAIVSRNQAEIELNRLRNRPLEETFRTAPQSIGGADFEASMAQLGEYVGDRDSFRIFRRFMVQEGLRDSPELQAIDAQIEAQRRVLTGATRSFWLPDLALEGDFSRFFARGGAGTGGGGFQGTDPAEALETTWSFAVGASLPLYEGNARPARQERARQELALLRLQRRSAAERVEQRIRNALHEMVGSYAQISLAREAANASRQNLELVQETYSQGVAGILDLLDAQNAAVLAGFAAATAEYDFLIDMTNVGRAVSRFDFLAPQDPTARRAWFDRMEAFFRAARQEGTGR
jgi:outer membrane protein TolC